MIKDTEIYRTILDHIGWYLAIPEHSRLHWTIADNIGPPLNIQEYWIDLDYRRLNGINYTMVDYIELYLTVVEHALLYKTLPHYIVYLAIPEYMWLYLTILDYNKLHRTILIDYIVLWCILLDYGQQKGQYFYSGPNQTILN